MPGVFGGTHGMSVFAETCYFIGALLYTVSIYGQVLESINADDRIGMEPENRPTRKFRWFAFQPARLAFMTPFVLLIGSLVFNYETTFALGSTLGVLPELLLWTTSLLGAVLFLVSCCMQFAEVGHSYLSWRPRDVSWWVAVFFILGSIGFIVGSLPGFGAPGLAAGGEILVIKLGFLLGGLFFLVGSYLMLPEMFSD